MTTPGAEDCERNYLRRSAQKSRTGCLKCKKRRVKCDETKPICLRCSRGDWKCDGYLQPRPVSHLRKQPKLLSKPPNDNTALSGSRIEARRLSISSQRNPFLDFQGTPKEHRSLDYFFSRVASDLGIFVDSAFWSIPAFRVTSLETSIQHALVALARYHEDHIRELELGDAINQKVAQPFALTQYNKAIKAVTSRLCRDRFGHQTALLACFLFVCLEFFKGSPDTALTQLTSGMMMLATYNRLYGRNRDHRDVMEGPSDEIVDEIETIFSRFRLSVVNTTPMLHKFYVPMGDFSPAEKISLAQPFSTIAGAKNNLDTIIRRTFQPCDTSPRGAIFGVVTEEQRYRRKLAITRLNDWAEQLGLLMIDTIISPTIEETRTIRLLRIQSIIASIFNSVTISGHQTDFDAHLSQFQSLFRLARQVVLDEIKHHKTNPSPPTKHKSRLYTFPLDPAMALAFLSGRCRHPILRRQAVNLLHHMSTALPAFRNCFTIVKIAERTIRFEESHCSSPVTADIATWPKEEQRIHGCFFLPVHGPKARIQTAIYFWQPVKGGEIKHWFERIGLDEALSWRVCFPEKLGV